MKCVFCAVTKRATRGWSDLATVSEVEVEASAGPGALNEEFVHEKPRWRLPEVMVRYEGDADPENLRILKVRGNSMEPEMSEGDRIVVDTARGSVRRFVLGPFCQTLTNLSPKMTANCVLASNHSRGGRFHVSAA